MADINAVDLTAETLATLDGTENVVGFDTAEGKKIQLSVLADYVMQKKTQSLLGTTQTPVNAITQANEMNMRVGTSIPANSDLDSYTTPGTFISGSASNSQTLSHCPTTSGFRLEVKYILSETRLMQTIYPNSQTEGIFYRVNTGSWGAWEKMPTRAEMDALALTSVTLTSNSDIINNATINCYTVGNLLVMSGWYKFKSTTQISQGTVLFTCGKQFQTRYYLPGYDGDGNFSVMYEVRESTNEIRARVAINPNTTPYYYISGVVAVKS